MTGPVLVAGMSKDFLCCITSAPNLFAMPRPALNFSALRKPVLFPSV
jgi:hypothetical protein